MHNCNLIEPIFLTFTENFQEHRTDLSALLLTPDKYLWLGSDESSTLERLSLIDGNNFGNHQQFRVAEFINLPAPESEEIDIEGLAYADYYLWLVGSHSYKRKKTKTKNTDVKNIQRLATVTSEPNRYILGRIPLVDGKLFSSCPHPQNPDVQLSAAKLECINQSNLLMTALADDPHLGLYIQAAVPGKDNGFDIEGISIYQNRIFLGLRGPVLRGWAVILEIELEKSTPGLMTLKPIGYQQKYKKHFLWLNGLGIRDLALDGEDLLILAGPTMDLDGPVQLYRWQGGVNVAENILSYPELIKDIPYGNREDHAEGMTLLNDVTGKPSLLIVYDSPAKSRLIGESGVIADLLSLVMGNG
ncbi:hypothetical protein NIES37_66580 [Tolypothrix tenuis PCC 7101]|uniref:DUF3616 domain-containing protein n=1 Tax=Tolypothrix tenuis PCC 7101 TaxID=231146 RepID=A0A1Z4NAE1_9CYAN|nr:DUF3616 domain-containing protein [Aulosira sp. FACHB-113]BAZ02645.1 hypothetical protein NIES37_66580 [Tolypothrix tenuis PCC 7101]BAZ73434.1 hypothetical protein NIES50_19990 [Aulosira laxa NIES-50]